MSSSLTPEQWRALQSSTDARIRYFRELRRRLMAKEFYPGDAYMNVLYRVLDALGSLAIFNHYAVCQAEKGREELIDRRPHEWLGDGI